MKIYENLVECYVRLGARIERDKYVRYYAPIWTLKKRGMFKYKWARVLYYRSMNRFWIMLQFLRWRLDWLVPVNREKLLDRSREIERRKQVI